VLSVPLLAAPVNLGGEDSLVHVVSKLHDRQKGRHHTAVRVTAQAPSVLNARQKQSFILSCRIYSLSQLIEDAAPFGSHLFWAVKHESKRFAGLPPGQTCAGRSDGGKGLISSGNNTHLYTAHFFWGR
jgi:hypothetical protein